MFSELLGAVQGVHVGRYDVRVPLDVVRSSGRSPEWSPLAVSANCMTHQTGLVRALVWAVEVAGQSLVPMPLCMDKNIHYWLL